MQLVNFTAFKQMQNMKTSLH